jgi:arginine/lysine/ornithine decarboxylase
MTINDFAKSYAQSGTSRLHMPAHKGVPLHGLEPLDLTEIKGADYLFESSGIIAESERKTAEAYGSKMTCYSAEGSSLSIKAALSVVQQYLGREITLAAPRNCHRAFLNGCSLIGIDVTWIYPDSPDDMLCRCCVSPKAVERCLEESRADAVYITSPDYLGSVADIEGISEVCRRHGAYLICDNAHGAYLKFLEKSAHPLDKGADIVCDSAHKTLPVYTGGAYLHIGKNAPDEFCRLAKPAMAMFGSTSPSYLIMESLDICADMLKTQLPEMIRECCKKVGEIKRLMAAVGIGDISAEPMKITIAAEQYGYSGETLAEMMRQSKIECEYADPAAVVLMFSPYNSDEDFKRVTDFIRNLPKKKPAEDSLSPHTLMPKAEKVLDIRTAVMKRCERISVDESAGRICARPAMSCQPSVAIIMAGEKITPEIIKILKKYSIFEIDVL